MLSKLIDFSLENRFLVLTITALIGLAGVYSALELPIDAVPDMTNVQVTVITEAGAVARGSRAVHHLPRRTGDGRTAEA